MERAIQHTRGHQGRQAGKGHTGPLKDQAGRNPVPEGPGSEIASLAGKRMLKMGNKGEGQGRARIGNLEGS